MTVTRWIKRIADWQPRNEKRSRGRETRGWRDDYCSIEGYCMVQRSKNMREIEISCRWLHFAEDGQSLVGTDGDLMQMATFSRG